MLLVRQAIETDVDQIRDIFVATYGEDYAYPQYYDAQMLKKMVFADDTLLLVAEETDTGRILGTASVVLHIGAYADLVGEFGRLAVHPDARAQGVGKRLMQGRLDEVQDQLHVGLVENRVAHPFSQRISTSFDFAPVGFCPMKLLLKKRESIALYCRHFGPALSLRRNHPRMIPEVFRLAEIALPNCGVDCDAIVNEEATPYPHNVRFQLDELTTEGYASLLRIERGRVRRREVFGPLRLHYGLFKLKAQHSHYLLARENGQVVGAIGFTVDEMEKVLRIFELISLGDGAIHFLLDQLVKSAPEKWGAEYLEADCSADAPQMQRTLLELGFLPVAYVPALVFHDVERLDAVKMARLMVPLDLEGVQLYKATQPIADVVIRQFVSRDVLPRVAEAVPRIALFSHLSEEQVNRLASACTVTTFQPGERLLVEGEPADAVFLMLRGEAVITVSTSDRPVARIGEGESLGEMSLISRERHSATATAQRRVETAVLSHDDLTQLIRMRPDIGIIIYRNLAAGLSEKLKRTTRQPERTVHHFDVG